MSESEWYAKGLLFENCSCQLVCPAHVSFKQQCTYERCAGNWVAHIRQGRFPGTALDDLTVVIAYDSPRRMYDGGWIQRLYIDERADAAQRRALEAIFSGAAGGPWQVLARFVGKQLESRFVPIVFEERDRKKSVRIEGLLETEVEAIRARDDAGEVTLNNLFNTIHGAIHVLARGRSSCRDGGIDFSNQDSHGLWSDFSWKGTVDGP